MFVKSLFLTGAVMLLSLIMHSPSLATWKESSFSFVSARWQKTVHEVSNTGPGAVTVNGEIGVDTQSQRVIGAADQNPPYWHSKFTPLSSTQVQLQWSIETYELPSMKVGRGLVLWDRELGWQEFEWYEGEGATGLKLRRDREWHANPGWAWGIYPITGED